MICLLSNENIAIKYICIIECKIIPLLVIVSHIFNIFWFARDNFILQQLFHDFFNLICIVKFVYLIKKIIRWETFLVKVYNRNKFSIDIQLRFYYIQNFVYIFFFIVGVLLRKLSLGILIRSLFLSPIIWFKL